MPASFPPARYDLPWKAALTHAFRAFMAFFFSELCTQIDWSKRPRFRDKELASLMLGDARDVCSITTIGFSSNTNSRWPA